jgi:hypothetical protein
VHVGDVEAGGEEEQRHRRQQAEPDPVGARPTPAQEATRLGVGHHALGKPVAPPRRLRLVELDRLEWRRTASRSVEHQGDDLLLVPGERVVVGIAAEAHHEPLGAHLRQVEVTAGRQVDQRGGSRGARDVAAVHEKVRDRGRLGVTTEFRRLGPGARQRREAGCEPDDERDRPHDCSPGTRDEQRDGRGREVDGGKPGGHGHSDESVG